MRIIICLFMLSSFFCIAQKSKNPTSFNYSISTGTGIELRGKDIGNRYFIGASIKDSTGKNYKTGCSVFYSYHTFNNIRSNFKDIQVQQYISLSTSYDFHSLTFPVYIEFQSKNVWMAAGGFIRYILYNETSQYVLNTSDTIYLQSTIFKYKLDKNTVSGMYHKLNFGPYLQASTRIDKNFSVGFIITFEILGDPIQYYFIKANTISFSPTLTFNL